MWATLNLKKIVKVTESTVYLSYIGRVSVFQIPPLATKGPLFDNIEDLPELAPVFTSVLPRSPLWFQKLDDWYYGDLGLPSYIDIFHRSDLGRSITDLFRSPVTSLLMYRELNSSTYRICGNRLVTCFNLFYRMLVEAHTTTSGVVISGFGLSSDCHESSRPVTEHVNLTLLANSSLGFAFCPASGRLVNVTDGKIVICDFL